MPVQLRRLRAQLLLARSGSTSSTCTTSRSCAATPRSSRILTNGAREPLDVGRATRVISPALRRALIVRDGHCVFPGCGRPHRWCDAHHLKHWAEGGETIPCESRAALPLPPPACSTRAGRWNDIPTARGPQPAQTAATSAAIPSYEVGTLAVSRPERSTVPGVAPVETPSRRSRPLTSTRTHARRSGGQPRGAAGQVVRPASRPRADRRRGRRRRGRRGSPRRSRPRSRRPNSSRRHRR